MTHAKADTPATDPHMADLGALVSAVPYIRYMGFRFDLEDETLRTIMPFRKDLIGNPMLPALHGGATAAFLETTAIVEVSRSMISDTNTSPGDALARRLPKTIDVSVDYLRPGLPQDAYARASINRAGRRYASVRVDAWQESQDRLFAQATVHFLMPS